MTVQLFSHKEEATNTHREIEPGGARRPALVTQSWALTAWERRESWVTGCTFVKKFASIPVFYNRPNVSTVISTHNYWPCWIIHCSRRHSRSSVNKEHEWETVPVQAMCAFTGFTYISVFVLMFLLFLWLLMWQWGGALRARDRERENTKGENTPSGQIYSRPKTRLLLHHVKNHC